MQPYEDNDSCECISACPSEHGKPLSKALSLGQAERGVCVCACVRASQNRIHTKSAIKKKHDSNVNIDIVHDKILIHTSPSKFALGVSYAKFQIHRANAMRGISTIILGASLHDGAPMDSMA